MAPPRHSAALIAKHFGLLLRVARTDMRSRYAGSLFGAGWAVLTPLLVLGAHALIYSVVLRVSPVGMTRVEYVLYVFAGMVPFIMTSEALAQGSGSILASRSVWANTVFPVDLAPVKTVLMSQVTMAVGLVGLLLVRAVTGGLSLSVLAVPLIWALHVLALIGVSWVLALVTLIFRDLQNAMGLLLMLLMIGTPIAYTAEMVPEQLRFLVALNPFAYFVHAYQEAIVMGRWPDPGTALVLVTVSLSFFVLGGTFFSRVKPVMLDHV